MQCKAWCDAQVGPLRKRRNTAGSLFLGLRDP